METVLAVIFGISTFFLLILWIGAHIRDKKKEKRLRFIWLCSMIYQWKETSADEKLFKLMFQSAMMKSSYEESGFTNEDYQKGLVLLTVFEKGKSEEIVSLLQKYEASENMIKMSLLYRGNGNH